MLSFGLALAMHKMWKNRNADTPGKACDGIELDIISIFLKTSAVDSILYIIACILLILS